MEPEQKRPLQAALSPSDRSDAIKARGRGGSRPRCRSKGNPEGDFRIVTEKQV